VLEPIDPDYSSCVDDVQDVLKLEQAERRKRKAGRNPNPSGIPEKSYDFI
jgi:hypothetical protein